MKVEPEESKPVEKSRKTFRELFGKKKQAIASPMLAHPGSRGMAEMETFISDPEVFSTELELEARLGALPPLPDIQGQDVEDQSLLLQLTHVEDRETEMIRNLPKRRKIKASARR